MKKEYLAVTVLALFILSYVLDYVAGPIDIPITNPFVFLQQHLSTYPFTAVAIAIKTIALFLTMLLIASFIEKKYFTKAIIVLFIAALFELYAIQQLATAQRLIPIGWTLSLAYSGLTLIPLTIIYFIMGITAGIYNKFKDEPGDYPVSSPTKQ